MKKKLAVALSTVALGLALFAGPASAQHPQPTMKADCKNGEFAEYRTSLMSDAPQRFKNQGDCIQFVNTGK